MEVAPSTKPVWCRTVVHIDRLRYHLSQNHALIPIGWVVVGGANVEQHDSLIRKGP